MADEISKIKLPNNTEYDIKDSIARLTASAAIPSSTKGIANGVAELDSNGLVPASQLPSYVDDVLEYTSKSQFPVTGETGKIYVATDTNLTYRWSGTAYVEISPSLALGETSSTAYRGDRGKTAYTHATDSSRLTTATASGLYKVASTAQGHIASLTAVTKADITGLGIPGSDTNTHRPIQVNGTEILGNNTTALNLKAGSNVSISNSSGTVTISATDTTYSSKAAASGGTDVSLVTTGEKYTWNSKAAGDHTHATSIATSTGTNQLTLAFGTKYALTAGGTSYVFTMPANPNTNTTYTLGTLGNNITLTPSSGSAQSITAPYATSAGSATKLGSSNVGSATQPIYLNAGTATACTYSLGATTNGGTAGRIAYYSGANAISSSGGLKYYTANSTASTPATRTILRVFGQTYGNTAANMISGTAGLFSYGDGSPQIAFSASENETSNSQDGALIFTDHDTAATGASWHFVSNQSDWNVTSKRFHARTGISIGTDLPQNWNGLRVQGINQNWLNVGKSPVIYMKKSDGGASGALGMDTKTGRVVIATYPANDDLLYFNWYADTTLAGTDNKFDAQMKWTPSTNTLSTNITGNASTISNFRVSTTSNLGIAVTYNAIGYVSGLTSDLWNYNRTDGCLYTQRYNDKYQHEIFGDYRTGRISVRGNNNGTWQDWKRVIVDEQLSNQDLNDIKIPGFYRAGGSNTVTNKPTGVDSFGMIVIHTAAGSYYYQLLNQTGTINTWRRTCSNGTWSDWVAENINNTDVNVKVNNTNPASGTWYYPVWYTATSGTGNVNANDGLRHYSLQGTASAAGRSILSLGNNTSTGTAGNKRGELFLYSEKSGRAEIVYDAASTATVVHTFPATAGTILNTGTTSFTQSLSSGTKIGTIKINGTSTDLYCQTNTNTWRPVQDNLTSDSTTDCLSAAQGKALANGSARDGTKLNKYGDDTMSGCLTSYKETTTGNNFPAGFRFSVKDLTTGLTNSDAYIYAYQDHGSTNTYGCNMVIRSCGGMFIGGGESPSNHYLAKGATYGGEDCFITSDGNVYVQANGNTIANRAGFYVDTSAALIPCKADSPVNLAGSIGTADYKWSLLYVNSIQGGTAYNTKYYDATTQTTGYCMHGRTDGNKYSCVWSSSKLNFYVDTTNVGNVSDRQLKSEIDKIDPKLLEAIAECEIYQYKAFNRDGLISVGIMAQDLVEKCEEKGVRPENYELLTKMNFIQGDDTLYYSVDYNQYATLMIDYLQKKVKELEEKIK